MMLKAVDIPPFFTSPFAEISIAVVKKEYKDCDGYYEYSAATPKFNLEARELAEEWSTFIQHVEF